MALRYVGRYATSRAKLAAYLARKLRERGWEGEGDPPIDSLVERFTELGYVDDAAFAANKARSLTARGYGARRLGDALYAAGIAESDAEEANRIAESQKIDAALAFARRRRFGPYAQKRETDPARREKQVAAMLRAGHPYGIVRKILDLSPGAAVNSADLLEN
ncbi:regulatory protein RecX [Sphingomicrobium lutaoense]|uniref:Regulatory protein RecX n=1 Tax=Sphingomicrobium lutaoense TaxID=515949 RepID=A0A839Z2E5_9SPHN|nr:regulatory protein RecX [Sphingomicrobium lutaoense]MBB3764217.1 regulatory protein [Sphingomicrobium lutaoense]